MVLMVLRIFNTFVLVFCVMCGLVSLEFMALFMVFNLQIGPGFIFEPCSYFVIFNSHFHVSTHRLEMFSGAYLKCYCVCGLQ
jgi:hypothetical protein